MRFYVDALNVDGALGWKKGRAIETDGQMDEKLSGK